VSGITIEAEGLPGLDIEADDEADADDAESVYQELARKVVTRLEAGFPKAAMAHAVELTNLIARRHDLGGGAWQ